MKFVTTCFFKTADRSFIYAHWMFRTMFQSWLKSTCWLFDLNSRNFVFNSWHRSLHFRAGIISKSFICWSAAALMMLSLTLFHFEILVFSTLKLLSVAMISVLDKPSAFFANTSALKRASCLILLLFNFGVSSGKSIVPVSVAVGAWVPLVLVRSADAWVPLMLGGNCRCLSGALVCSCWCLSGASVKNRCNRNA